jgi:hypothetical protein
VRDEAYILCQMRPVRGGTDFFAAAAAAGVSQLQDPVVAAAAAMQVAQVLLVENGRRGFWRASPLSLQPAVPGRTDGTLSLLALYC